MITLTPDKIRADGGALVMFSGPPNAVVVWSLTGPGSLIPLATTTDASGRAFARYVAPSEEGTAEIRVDYGTTELLPVPAILLAVTPAEDYRGHPVSITWSSTNVVGDLTATSSWVDLVDPELTGDGVEYAVSLTYPPDPEAFLPWAGVFAQNGALDNVYFAPDANKALTLRLSGAGVMGLMAEVAVVFPCREPAPLGLTFTGPATASPNIPFTLEWATAHAEEGRNATLTASGDWSGTKALPNGSEQWVEPAAGLKTYTLTLDSDTQAPVVQSVQVDVQQAAIGPYGVIVVAASLSTPYLRLFDSETMREMEPPTEQPAGSANHLAFSPDGTKLAVAHATSPYLTVYDTATWAKLPPPATLPAGSANEVAWSPDGSLLVVGHTSSPYITIYDTTTWAKLANPPTLPPNTGQSVAFSPDGSLLVVGHTSSPYITIYDTTTWAKLPNPAQLPGYTAVEVRFSPDGTKLAVSSSSSSPYFWVYNTADWTRYPAPSEPPTSSVYALAFTPDSGKLIVAQSAGSGEQALRVYSVADWSVVAYPPMAVPQIVYGLLVYDEGQLLVTCGSYAPLLSVINTADWTKIVDPYVSPEAYLKATAFAPIAGRPLKPLPLTVDLTGPAEAVVGVPFTLSWTTTGTEESVNPVLTASGGWSGVKALPSGSEEVTPLAGGDITYTLTLTSENQDPAEDSVTVSVTAPPWYGANDLALEVYSLDTSFAAMDGLSFDQQPVSGCGAFTPNPLVTLGTTAHTVSPVTDWAAGAACDSSTQVAANQYYAVWTLYNLPVGRSVTVSCAAEGGAWSVTGGGGIRLHGQQDTGTVDANGQFSITYVPDGTSYGGSVAPVGSTLTFTVTLDGA